MSNQVGAVGFPIEGRDRTGGVTLRPTECVTVTVISAGGDGQSRRESTARRVRILVFMSTSRGPGR
jgi:hypothetical protein